MQTRGVRGQKIPKNANVICERPLTSFVFETVIKCQVYSGCYYIGFGHRKKTVHFGSGNICSVLLYTSGLQLSCLTLSMLLTILSRVDAIMVFKLEKE